MTLVMFIEIPFAVTTKNVCILVKLMKVSMTIDLYKNN